MSVLKTFKKKPLERRRLHLDYGSRWLEDTEELVTLVPSVLPVTVPPLVVDGIVFSIPQRQAVMYASGGLVNTTYTITITVTTDEGQTKLDDIGLKVKP